jgi:hypothetical protein
VEKSLGVSDLRRDLKRQCARFSKSPAPIPSWPQVNSEDIKDKIPRSFIDNTSSNSLCEYACACCSGSFRQERLHSSPVPLSAINRDLLKPFAPLPTPLASCLPTSGILSGLAVDLEALSDEVR